jgi:O-antigen/teichoic acid export membrane protein
MTEKPKFESIRAKQCSPAPTQQIFLTGLTFGLLFDDDETADVAAGGTAAAVLDLASLLIFQICLRGCANDRRIDQNKRFHRVYS